MTKVNEGEWRVCRNVGHYVRELDAIVYTAKEVDELLAARCAQVEAERGKWKFEAERITAVAAKFSAQITDEQNRNLALEAELVQAKERAGEYETAASIIAENCRFQFERAEAAESALRQYVAAVDLGFVAPDLVATVDKLLTPSREADNDD
jgi:hypothetical protein